MMRRAVYMAGINVTISLGVLKIMKPISIRIDYDETHIGQFKVTISYHERDTADRLGLSADVVVYVATDGRTLPQSAPEISDSAVASARKFLQKILDT